MATPRRLRAQGGHARVLCVFSGFPPVDWMAPQLSDGRPTARATLWVRRVAADLDRVAKLLPCI
eukprot:1220914-Pyramimonas_sp.AAC.1